MKNRLLCCLLVCLLLSTLALPAAAQNDYLDQAEIQNQQSVALLTKLGIITGFPNHTFRPAQHITRAEMAKIIASLLLPQQELIALRPQYGVFSDVDHSASGAVHWASSYIYWCYRQGIIHGDTAPAGSTQTTFRPDDTVTGVEAAKMLLTALGYDAELEGLLGPGWDKSTSALALGEGIYDGFLDDDRLPLSRDAACLLSCNALNIHRVDTYETDASGATKRRFTETTLMQLRFSDTVANP